MTRYATSAPQRLVGWYLRDYRESAGYDLADAARVLGCSRSKISRVEAGQRGIPAKELCALLAGYGARPAVMVALAALARPHRDGDGWWTGYASVLPEPYLEFAAAEATYPAAVAGNCRVPSSPPRGSRAAATCTSERVSTPTVMAGFSSTMVIAVPFWVKGWHAPAGRRTREPRPLAQARQIGRQSRWVPEPGTRPTWP
jgi:transcriptional regulator with XRE-family HTH domain